MTDKKETPHESEAAQGSTNTNFNSKVYKDNVKKLRADTPIVFKQCHTCLNHLVILTTVKCDQNRFDTFDLREHEVLIESMGKCDYYDVICIGGN